jgi:aldose 1-epimerase
MVFRLTYIAVIYSLLSSIDGQTFPEPTQKEIQAILNGPLPTIEIQGNTQEIRSGRLFVDQETFGQTDRGANVDLFTLTNTSGHTVKITNYGGIVTSLLVPDKNGNLEDIVLGFDDFQSYLDGHPYFGAIVGRYANRIAGGMFELKGVLYKLAANDGKNHLHGGIKGFDKVVWNSESFKGKNEVGIKLSYVSKDMEEGYPGNLKVKVIYRLTNENQLMIDYFAETDKACPVNLTHHGYFNLTAGKQNILNHEMMIKASSYVVIDENLIPTGEIRDLIGTEMDFTQPNTVGSRIDQIKGGYDHCYVINKKPGQMSLIARVYEQTSGRVMEVYSTEPGVQFYSGNFLDGSLIGKHDIVYNKHFGFCLETQHFPDSPNRENFPTTMLYPGEKYTHSTVYQFSIH